MAIAELTAPPLAAGDKLTRDEFLRHWEQCPEITRAELIGGIVYMPSPVSAEHGNTEDDVGGWLFNYRINTPGTDSGSNATTLLQNDSPQPDRHLRVLPECGGNSRVVGKYLSGAAELMAEVCLSSKAYDLNQKYDLYEAAGVQEYLAILMYEQEVRWHALVNGRYQILAPDPDGILRSRAFPGLWLDGNALLRRDIAKVIATLQQGLASAEHRAFVEQLAARRAGGNGS